MGKAVLRFHKVERRMWGSTREVDLETRAASGIWRIGTLFGKAISIPGTRQKKIAIPFRAADVPSERSEFSHPDVCIVLTLLGYYHDCLTEDEVAFAVGYVGQHQQYDQWYKSVEPGLSEEEGKTLCDVRHISLADARQLETLCRV
ncbi:Hypothetical protein PHPALM_1559 [Phytophthora palmivora]|uniref:DUF3645 domain-containing protein n=1 Tax=Phytophthora palmivora TaxID=4796 RepID=A0A2P4YRY8_9STRA|nr:Hypothetical protein PHPALM_1559 [Phytophthora palmivora]